MSSAKEIIEQEADYQVPALQRGLRILEMFSGSSRVLTTAQMAQQLGVSSSAIYRIVQTLTQMGYLYKKDKTHYELGSRVMMNGFSWLASRDIVDVAAPHLNELRNRSSCSCHLAVRDQTDALYIYRAYAYQRLAVNVPIGTRLPCHATALGRVLLCALNHESLNQLYRHVLLDTYTASQSPQSLPELQATIEEDRRRGWVEHQSDFATSLAAPICDYTGNITAAINLSVADALLDNDNVRRQLLSLLLDCATKISLSLGCQSRG
ncbi:IclR family transcriptional regulator [Stenoxybacter acetivorans]|uniref:IclR family transcriptional regulator n=1 Tax=Stenoxybacter acetivorans TaxID=422441 RepID=UPI00069043FF|nr:IclR family transcriptional regulator [Stenoxybacter acetivorans]